MIPPIPDSSRPEFVTLLLAAGDSQRMGRPKALLEIAGQPAFLRCARASLGAGARKVLVLVARAIHDEVERRLPLAAERHRRIVPIEVPEKLRRRGPIGSILHGIRMAGPCPGWLLWPVDHPFVAVDTIERLAAAEGAIRIPRFDDRRGHPIFVDGSQRDDLLATIERGGTLRDYVRRYQASVADVPVHDPAIHWNCNSPAAFATWLAEFEGGSGRGRA